jgi:serine/threonine protein phosphatase PrpC
MSLTYFDCSLFSSTKHSAGVNSAHSVGTNSSYVMFNPSFSPGRIVLACAKAARQSLGGQIASTLALEHFVNGVFDYFNALENKVSSASVKTPQNSQKKNEEKKKAVVLKDVNTSPDAQREQLQNDSLQSSGQKSSGKTTPGQIVDEKTALLSDQISLRLLEYAFKNANHSVYTFGHKLAAGGKMAASLLGLALVNDVLTVGRVGDGIGYLVRNGHVFQFFQNLNFSETQHQEFQLSYKDEENYGDSQSARRPGRQEQEKTESPFAGTLFQNFSKESNEDIKEIEKDSSLKFHTRTQSVQTVYREKTGILQHTHLENNEREHTPAAANDSMSYDWMQQSYKADTALGINASVAVELASVNIQEGDIVIISHDKISSFREGDLFKALQGTVTELEGAAIKQSESEASCITQHDVIESGESNIKKEVQLNSKVQALAKVIFEFFQKEESSPQDSTMVKDTKNDGGFLKGDFFIITVGPKSFFLSSKDELKRCA